MYISPQQATRNNVPAGSRLTRLPPFRKHDAAIKLIPLYGIILDSNLRMSVLPLIRNAHTAAHSE